MGISTFTSKVFFFRVSKIGNVFVECLVICVALGLVGRCKVRTKQEYWSMGQAE